MESWCAQIICRRCNQPGYYACGCATNINQQGLANQNQSNELNVPNVPHVNINNVSSYFVVGKAFETSVSFSVDTGAVLSLL